GTAQEILGGHFDYRARHRDHQPPVRSGGCFGFRPADFFGYTRRGLQRSGSGAQLYWSPVMIEVQGLRAGYGAINILWDVSISVRPGELTTIIGPNGAGKTTLLRAIMGLLPVSQGTIQLNDKPLSGIPTWKMPDLGVVMIPEGRMVFKDMTIEENLMLGAFTPKHRAGSRRQCDKAYDMFPRLRERRNQRAGTLSGGEAQMLAMGRGLMADPQVLIIDEPSLGLAPVVVNELFQTLGRLKAEGR